VTGAATGLARRLTASDDATVAFRARTLVLGEPEDAPGSARLRRRIAGSERARRLLSHLEQDGTIATNPYRKWQGPHWTLVQLATIDYPPGDEALRPLRDQAYRWILEPAHLRFPRSVTYPEQPERVRRCASQEGNALWYSVRLGLEDEQTALLADRLVRFQWPDGGWNCDKRRQARTSSFVETLLPLRGLTHYGRAHRDRAALAAVDRAAQFLLERRLFWRRRDGAPASPAFFRIEWPISLYGLLIALEVMAEAGRVTDPRCADALDLLEAKRLPDGSFPAECPTARTVDGLATRGTWADWGPGGKRRGNDLVTVTALAVLRAAGRLPA
jgi:hypothetical protein